MPGLVVAEAQRTHSESTCDGFVNGPIQFNRFLLQGRTRLVPPTVAPEHATGDG
jgi:hypothetical protein